MATAEQVLDRLTDQLGYSETGGFERRGAVPATGPRAATLTRLDRRLRDVSAVYFAEDVPLAYFALRDSVDAQQGHEIHRRVWNDAGVPLLFIVASDSVRVYDAWARPESEPTERPASLIRLLSASDDFLASLPQLERTRLDTGTYTKELADRFDVAQRCDTTLLDNLAATRRKLVAARLPDDVAHVLLLRSILILHLEHRGVLRAADYSEFLPSATTLTDIYADREATYRLFDALATRFNGDLLPVTERERLVKDRHVALLGRLLDGREEIDSGQLALWPLYDFGVVPIQLISAAYETLLHESDPVAARHTGAYFTPLALVELVLNELLPWPAPGATPPARLPHVIDPSCGSGVFLVGAFHRLAAAWQQGRPRARHAARELSKVMRECIHGIDQNPLAVRIAAFSLCLALLDSLEPDEIRLGLRFPRLRSEDSDVPGNLRGGDAFKLAAAGGEFDVVVGNPPWRRAELPRHVAKWCQTRDYPVAGEIAQAFMWLAHELAPRGRIGLLCPGKWLFNREGPDAAFRRAFFERNHVETVVNLAALAGGGNRLFQRASAPATAVVYRPGANGRDSKAILYCTPRPARDERGTPGLLLDAADIKWLPRHDSEQVDDIWKVLYFAAWRDLRLVRRLAASGTSLGSFIESRKASGWRAARGFQPGGRKSAPRLHEIAFLPARKIHPFVLSRRPSKDAWPRSGFKRTGPLAIYESPHVMVKEGMEGGRLCGALALFPCSFRDTITGIHAPRHHLALLKALTVYLNSALASYQLLLTSGWGIDRRRAKKGEVLELPAIVLEDEHRVAHLAGLLDEHTQAAFDREREALVARMDEEVFRAFDVGPGERTLVEDLLHRVASEVAAPGTRSPSERPSHRELEAYAHAFRSVIGEVVGGSTVLAEIFDPAAPLQVVSFRLVEDSQAADPVARRDVGMAHDLLRRLDRRLLQREGLNLYRRRHLRLFEDGLVHVVKPAQARFWTRSAAFTDADEVLAQVLSSGRHVAG